MPAVHLKTWICAAVLSFISATALAASDSGWSLHAWLSDDGLPNNNVTSIAQTADGYLWVANPTALARFDGVQFESFAPKSLGLVPNERVRVLCPGHAGGLWLGTDDSVIFADGQRRQVFTNVPNISPEWVLQALLEDNDGSLWMTFNHGVVCQLKTNGQTLHFTAREGMPDGPVCSLVKDSHGLIWFSKSGQKNGQVGFFRDGYFQAAATFGRPALRLEAARDGGIWICNGPQLLKLKEGERPVDLGTFLPEHPSLIPTAVLEDSHGAVWIGTADSGLFRFDGSKFESVPTSHQQISDLMEDREGNIWAGTYGGGLDRLRPRAVGLEGGKQGLPFESVMSLCEDSAGVLWVAMQNGLLAYREQDAWKPFKFDNLLPSSVKATNIFVSCIAADRKGALWLGTKERTLYCLQNGELTARGPKVGPKGGLISRRVRSLLVASNGDVWIGGESPDSIQCLRSNELKTYAVPPNVRSIRTIAEDKNGNIWVGASSGYLLRIKDDTLVDETSRTSGEPLSIRALCAGPDGTLWIGYAGDGLGRFKDGQYHRYTTSHGLYDNYVSQIVADDRGWLWFGGDRGIFKIEQQELDDVANGKRTRVHSTHYGRDEGLSSLQANFDVSPGAIRTHDGRVWIPMRTGLATINPEALSQNATPPPVLLRQVVVDDQVVAAYGGIVPVPETVNLQPPQTVLHLPPSYHRMQFDFTALGFSTPENVHFRCRLDGFDDNWVETETRNAVYPRLSPGHYHFRVQARNESGAWNDMPAPLALIIQPFFWQTWWFQFALFVLFTALVIATVRYISFRRLRRELHALEQQAALDKERARIARDIHDDLGGSMTQITLLSGLISRDIANPEKANGYAQRISSASKNVTDSLDEIVWAMNPRNDTLPHLINYLGKFTAEYLLATGVKCRMDLPAQPGDQYVSSETRHNLFLAVKEALNNVTRHAQAGEVFIQIVTDEKSMDVRIQDNGRGFDQAPRIGCAEGLHNMQQRMQEIGGQCRIESNPGKGTRVNFIFPLKNTSNGK